MLERPDLAGKEQNPPARVSRPLGVASRVFLQFPADRRGERIGLRSPGGRGAAPGVGACP